MSIETAEQFEENGQYEEAYAEYKKSYEHSPKDLSLLAQLGHIAMILGKKDEAEQYYNIMLTLDATNPTAYEQLMDIYMDKMNETVNFIKEKVNNIPKIAIILGSGLGSLSDDILNKTILLINCF